MGRWRHSSAVPIPVEAHGAIAARARFSIDYDAWNELDVLLSPASGRLCWLWSREMSPQFGPHQGNKEREIDLASCGFTPEDYGSRQEWSLSLHDASGLTVARVREFHIEIFTRTDRTDVDADDDGMWDGLEVLEFRASPTTSDIDADNRRDALDERAFTDDQRPSVEMLRGATDDLRRGIEFFAGDNRGVAHVYVSALYAGDTSPSPKEEVFRTDVDGKFRFVPVSARDVLQYTIEVSDAAGSTLVLDTVTLSATQFRNLYIQAATLVTGVLTWITSKVTAAVADTAAWVHAWMTDTVGGMTYTARDAAQAVSGGVVDTANTLATRIARVTVDGVVKDVTIKIRGGFTDAGTGVRTEWEKIRAYCANVCPEAWATGARMAEWLADQTAAAPGNWAVLVTAGYSSLSGLVLGPTGEKIFVSVKVVDGFAATVIYAPSGVADIDAFVVFLLAAATAGATALSATAFMAFLVILIGVAAIALIADFLTEEPNTDRCPDPGNWGFFGTLVDARAPWDVLEGQNAYVECELALALEAGERLYGSLAEEAYDLALVHSAFLLGQASDRAPPFAGWFWGPEEYAGCEFASRRCDAVDGTHDVVPADYTAQTIIWRRLSYADLYSITGDHGDACGGGFEDGSLLRTSEQRVEKWAGYSSYVPAAVRESKSDCAGGPSTARYVVLEIAGAREEFLYS